MIATEEYRMSTVQDWMSKKLAECGSYEEMKKYFADYKKFVGNNSTTYTYQIPVSALPPGSCGCIAAHAVVVKLNEVGEVIEQQTAWGHGTRINPTGNWGMKFDYCSCVL